MSSAELGAVSGKTGPALEGRRPVLSSETLKVRHNCQVVPRPMWPSVYEKRQASRDKSVFV